MENKDYFYVVVRQDISIADQVCQVAHACAEAGKYYGHPAHTNLVLLGIQNKGELLVIAEKLRRNRVDFFLNHEPDDNMGETALCTGVVTGSTRRLFAGMPLWKAEETLV